MESYIIKNGEKLKKGYTTGSTAAAAARAAAGVLFSGREINRVTIDTPAGVRLTVPVARLETGKNFVWAGVKKDGGDDPDVTDDLLIRARVEKISAAEKNQARKNAVKITGGQGVGTVTRPGLPVVVGEPAINPVPRKMITEEVKKELPPRGKVKVTLEIPRGKEVARKTMNKDLGIKGGISILGTTGLVEPMSHRAIKDSLALKLKQLVAEKNPKKVILVFGKQGQKQAEHLGFSPEYTLKMSNYVGFMLDQCVKEDIKEVVLLGQPGKLIKVAGGIFNTHSKVADARLEILAARVAEAGGSQELISKILSSVTAKEARQYITEAGLMSVFTALARLVVERAEKRIKNKLAVKAIFYTGQGRILASWGPEGEEIIDE